MYLSTLDLEVTAKRILAGLERRGVEEAGLDLWDGSWPPSAAPGGPQVLRVEPDKVITDIAALTSPEAPLTRLAHVLRHRYDLEGESEWTFLPGRHGVLLARLSRKSVSN